jgi:multidrug transporter EmrE-like cation transporter
MKFNATIGLVLTIISNSIANTLIKIAMSHADKTKGIITAYVLNPFLMGAVVLFIFSLFGYSYALTKMKLSVVYPVMISSCFIIVLAASWFYLKEDVSLIQIIGIIFIVGGIWLVLKNKKEIN